MDLSEARLSNLPHSNLQSVTLRPSNVQPAIFPQLTQIAHSDWSKDSNKRWMAFAQMQADQRWHVSDLIKIDQPSQLFLYLKSQMILPGCILAGFDFPIGLPRAFATKAGISRFLSALPLFGDMEWADFYLPAEKPSEISVYRPFYPARPGHSKRNHLEQALGIPFDQLYRLCEIAHDNRRPACPLFWTMGGQQVGKAAISGWTLLLTPALNDPTSNVKIWPFSGSFMSLCYPGNIVLVETYPAEYYPHLGLSFNSPIRRSKRRQSDRLAFAAQLIRWAQNHDMDLSIPLVEKIQAGFGNSAYAEDQFDAVVGLYGMINVIMGTHSIGEPTSPIMTEIEGWIFGQEQPIEGSFRG